MGLDKLKLCFDTQNLTFARIDREGNDLVAILKDAEGSECSFARDTFFCKGAKKPSRLEGAMKQAYDELTSFTHETFDDLLMCHDYARWLHVVELQKGLFSLSFHVHHTVLDHDVTNFILTTDEISRIYSEKAQALETLIRKGAPAIQVAAESNRNILYGAIHPTSRDRLHVSHRITDKMPLPPKQGPEPSFF